MDRNARVGEPGRTRPPTAGIHVATAIETVEVVPSEEVERITAQCRELIDQLEADLAAALDEATDAETRLRRHPAAAVFDDEFEAFVLRATESRAAEIRREHRESQQSGATTPQPEQTPPAASPTPSAHQPATTQSAHVDVNRMKALRWTLLLQAAAAIAIVALILFKLG